MNRDRRIVRGSGGRVAVRMSDVARHAGVSQRTVSNVVNNFVHVAPDTRARVEASLRELGYRPNIAARQLRRGRTGTVTLAVPGLDERYFADLADALIRAARETGIRVLVETTGGDRERERELLDGGGGLLTDGLIMSAVALRPRDRLTARPTAPVVLVGDRELAGPIDHVGIANRPAARAAVEHLLGTGRRRVALLGSDPSATLHSHALRRQGYVDALEGAGIPLDESLIFGGEWTRRSGEAVMDGIIEAGELPDGVFAMNDSMALGALRSLERHGVDVPGRVAVVGFDDIAEAASSTPSLTTISPELDVIARTALELIADQGRNDDPERPAQHRHLDFLLRVRESSASDPH